MLRKLRGKEISKRFTRELEFLADEDLTKENQFAMGKVTSLQLTYWKEHFEEVLNLPPP